MFRVSIILVLLLALSSCMGRKKDETSKRPFHIEISRLGIQSSGSTKPMLLAFGALWCQPCRAEIDDLNEAYHQFMGKVDIVGVVTEGYVKGEVIEESHFRDFDSTTGRLPEYQLVADKNWKIFDELRAKDGHRLPTMVLLDKERRIISIIQRTLDYATELKPMLESLASGQEEIKVVEEELDPEAETTGPETPETEEPQDEGEGSTTPTKPVQNGPTQMYVYEWLEAIEKLNPAANLVSNMEIAWRKAVTKFNFKEGDVPFDDGELTVKYVNGFPTPFRAYWAYVSATGGQCSLSIYFNQDGSYKKASGICQ